MTVENDPYRMPEMPDGVEEGILKGMYKFKASTKKRAKLKANLFGSGAIMNGALEAQKILEEDYKVSADVWSITSYKALHRDCLDAERWNRMHPGDKTRLSYLEQCLEKESGVYVMASDYVKALPESIARWFPNPPVALGTDGFGRSESREALRDHFEVDARFIVLGALGALAREGEIDVAVVTKAMKDLKIDPEKANPAYL
jgi:pyruvate dehydrogenase E1 component